MFTLEIFHKSILVFCQLEIYSGNIQKGKCMIKKRKYHHGNLKKALILSARDLLKKDGLNGLTLRKCAEHVGVSHTAPKNHFGNMAGLLTAIVTEAYSELAQMMKIEQIDGTTREQRRQAALLGYVSFAKRNPSLYELMFSHNRLVNDDPDLMREVGACFIILADIAEDLGWYDGNVDEVNGKSQVALWSLVHGYAQLVTAGRFKKTNMQNLSILDIFPSVIK